MVEPYEPAWLDRLVNGALPSEGLTTWVPSGAFESSALVRVPRYPREVDDQSHRTLSLEAVRNEQQSGQIVAIADEPLTDLSVTVEDLEESSGATIAAENVRGRFVEFVPVVRGSSEYTFSAVIEDVVGDEISGSRSPDLVGDPLIEADAVDVPALRAQPIWFTVEIPADATPGTYEGQVHLDCAEFDRVSYDLELEVRDVTLPDPTEYDFHMDVWINPFAVAVEHGVEQWSDAHWELLEAYFDDLASRSQSVVLTTIMEEPWQQSATDYDSMVAWHYDDGGGWRFDYEVFDRFVETALEHGVGPEIGAYSLLTFSAPERVTYFEDGERVVEELEAGSDRWVECWTAFLEDFSAHLRERGWYDQTLISIDERHEDAMNAARELLESVVPELAERIQLAGLVDSGPYAFDLSANFTAELPLDEALIEERRAAGKRTTFYTAGQPNHPNALAFSPAVESRMLPWIAAENDLDGYLRWAYNNWPHDVRENPVYNYVQGDEYLVYPGDEGPASSVRWELLREGIEDYELAGKLRESDPDSNALSVALDLATREHDGRETDLTDIPQARRLIVDALE